MLLHPVCRLANLETDYLGRLQILHGQRPSQAFQSSPQRQLGVPTLAATTSAAAAVEVESPALEAPRRILPHAKSWEA